MKARVLSFLPMIILKERKLEFGRFEHRYQAGAKSLLFWQRRKQTSYSNFAPIAMHLADIDTIEVPKIKRKENIDKKSE